MWARLACVLFLWGAEVFQIFSFVFPVEQGEWDECIGGFNMVFPNK